MDLEKTEKQERQKSEQKQLKIPYFIVIFGLVSLSIVVIWATEFLFDAFNLSFFDQYKDEESGLITGILLAIASINQYLWQNRHIISRFTALFGLFSVSVGIIYASYLIFYSLDLCYPLSFEGSLIAGILLSILLIIKYLWQRRTLNIHPLSPFLIPICLILILFFGQYNIYWNRAKIAEAYNLLIQLKIPAEKYYHLKGIWPSLDALDSKTSGKYVENIRSNKSAFYFEARMKKDGSPVSNRVLRLYYDDGKWHCNSYYYAHGLPYRYRPIDCQ